METTVNDAYTAAEVVINEITSVLTTYGLDVLGALAILMIGLWLAGKVERMIRASLAKTGRIDETLKGFFASLAKYGVMIFTGVAVLNQFGVQTASLLTVLGAAGLAIGLALQGTLSNVAAGVMLLIFRPFKAGDFIEAAGHAGTIKDLNLFFTLLATGDNVRIIVPNSQVWGSSLKNYSSNDTRRIDFSLGVDYATDLDHAMRVIQDVVDAEPRALKEPEGLVAVSEMADSSVNFVVRVWVKNGDYWPTRFDLMKAFKQRFDKEGIGIPFPCRTVYTVEQKGK